MSSDFEAVPGLPPSTVTYTGPLERFSYIRAPGTEFPAGEPYSTIPGALIQANQVQADGTHNVVVPDLVGDYMDNDSGQPTAASIVGAYRTEWAAIATEEPTWSAAQIQQKLCGIPAPVVASQAAPEPEVLTGFAPVVAASAPPAPAPVVEVAERAPAPAPAVPIPAEHIGKLHEFADAIERHTVIDWQGFVSFVRSHFPKL